MNVYQKVLVRLFEEAGGRDSKAIYLKDVLKDMGFFPSYSDILSQMNHDGWVTETSRTGEVKLTHWGIREAKNLSKGGTDNTREIGRVAGKLKSESKLFGVMIEELVEDVTPDNFQAAEKKLASVSKALEGLKKLM